MTEPDVKRRYRSAVREERRAHTRASIRAAAGRLFVRDGYVATSMRAIAAEAGVGERTMYDAFPTKSALYAHCLGVAIVGDELDIAAIDRDAYAEALGHQDPIEILTATVDFNVALLDRAGDLIFVGIEAQAAEPELRAMGREAEKATHDFYTKLVVALQRRGALAVGMTITTAADIAFTLGSPFVHRLLRRERGWSTARYRSWLITTLQQQLLSAHSAQLR
jgi:AcrR family transcriptional regulator